jgi:hypothetical protein
MHLQSIPENPPNGPSMYTSGGIPNVCRDRPRRAQPKAGLDKETVDVKASP